MKTMKMILWMDKEKDNIRRQKVGQKQMKSNVEKKKESNVYWTVHHRNS